MSRRGFYSGATPERLRADRERWLDHAVMDLGPGVSFSVEMRAMLDDVNRRWYAEIMLPAEYFRCREVQRGVGGAGVSAKAE